MPFVHYFTTGPLVQIEGFPTENFKRSREGALHLRPGSGTELTLDEYEFIRENHKDVARNMRILAYLSGERKPPDKPEWNDAPQVEAPAAAAGPAQTGPIEYEEVEGPEDAEPRQGTLPSAANVPSEEPAPRRRSTDVLEPLPDEKTRAE